MNYLKLLEHSYHVETTWGRSECPPESRHEYLAEHIFGFVTYDFDISELMGRYAAEVCAAINDGKTFEYIKDEERYKWYLLMCNMPFFVGRLEWGTSIRGAWWYSGKEMRITSCGLWEGDEQLLDIEFSADAWKEFIAAIVAFAQVED